MPVLIEFLNAPEDPELKKLLKTWGEKLLKESGLEQAELSVVVTDDETIKELNRRWRSKDKPTDVLSFPQDLPPALLPEDPISVLKTPRSARILGDVVISADTALRQARGLGHPRQEEFKRLLVHGFIHLLGFDHEIDKEQEERFRALEEFLIKRI